MRKNFIKKIASAVVALTMVVGSTGVVFGAAHAANGANIATNVSWDSFSVCDGHHGLPTTEWEQALKDLPQTYLVDYATEGWFTALGSSDFTFHVKSTGWDGEYYNGELVADNPYGMTVQTNKIPIEKGRVYTVSFKIKSTLSAKVDEVDADGVKTGNKITKTVKHIGMKIYDPVSNGGPALSLDTIDGADLDGIIELDSAKEDYTQITAQVTVPDNYGSDYMGVMFTLGARMVSFPDEIALAGDVDIKDFKITAGNQYTVTYKGNGKSRVKYVNAGGSAKLTSDIYGALSKAGCNIDGFKLNGSKYVFGTPVNGNITLEAIYVNTPKPAKMAKPTVKSPAKKKAKVTIKKIANAKGYEVRYALKKNMKGAKKKTFTKASVTVKSLKSKKLYFFQVRAYNTDSTGAKIWGAYSKAQKAFVK